MRSVLIVDDEKYIRKGLRMIIENAGGTFTSVYDAGSMHGAMKILEERRIDLVITDIRMPKGSGLELMEKIGQLTYKPFVIVLSGYDEFEYAQNAMKYGAKAYLLKPVKQQDLIDILNTIEEELSVSKKEEYLQSEGKNRRCIQLIENTDLTVEEMQVECRELGINLVEENYRVIAFYQKKSSLLQQGHYEGSVICLDDIIEKNSGYPIGFPDNEGNYIVIIPADDNFTKLAKFFSNPRNSDYYAGISEVLTGAECLPSLYRQALSALRYRMIRKVKKMIFFADIKVLDGNPVVPVKETDKLISLIGSGKFDKINKLLADLFMLENLEILSMDYIEAVSAFLINRIFDNVVETIPQYKKTVNPSRAKLEDLYGFPSIRDYLSDVKNFLMELDRYRYNLGRQFQDRYAVDLAVKWIKNNYKDCNLSMTTAADHVHLNYSYFSYFFKEHTKMKFVDYVKKVRVDKAKKMLETSNAKINEIARSVGFLTTKNFRKSFLQNTGCSPTEYRLKGRTDER